MILKIKMVKRNGMRTIIKTTAESISAFNEITDFSMWGPLFVLTFGIVMYFLDIGFDILVAREQLVRALARHNTGGKIKKQTLNFSFVVPVHFKLDQPHDWFPISKLHCQGN